LSNTVFTIEDQTIEDRFDNIICTSKDDSARPDCKTQRRDQIHADVVLFSIRLLTPLCVLLIGTGCSMFNLPVCIEFSTESMAIQSHIGCVRADFSSLRPAVLESFQDLVAFRTRRLTIHTFSKVTIWHVFGCKVTI